MSHKNKSLREQFREIIPAIDVDRDWNPDEVIASVQDRFPEFLARTWETLMDVLREEGLTEEQYRYQKRHPYPTLAEIGDPRIPRVIELLNPDDLPDGPLPPAYPDTRVAMTRRAVDQAGGVEEVKTLVLNTVKDIYAGCFKDYPGRWKTQFWRSPNEGEPQIVVRVDTQTWDASVQTEEEEKFGQPPWPTKD